MKTTIAVRLAVSAIIVLGGATAASAQEPATEFTDVGCVFNLALIAGVPEPFSNLAPATVEGNTVFCPGSEGNEAVILECSANFSALGKGPWPADVTINTTNFDCFVNASQCGNPVTRLATSQRFTVDQFGNADLRCSVSRTR